MMIEEAHYKCFESGESIVEFITHKNEEAYSCCLFLKMMIECVSLEKPLILEDIFIVVMRNGDLTCVIRAQGNYLGFEITPKEVTLLLIPEAYRFYKKNIKHDLIHMIVPFYNKWIIHRQNQSEVHRIFPTISLEEERSVIRINPMDYERGIPVWEEYLARRDEVLGSIAKDSER